MSRSLHSASPPLPGEQERDAGEDQARRLLALLAAGPASGAGMARALGVSRTSIWKRIEALRGAGIEIDARPGRGYALRHPLQLLDADLIHACLPAEARMALAGPGAVEVAWSLDSTNSALLRRSTPAKGASVLLAECQTGGRGRRGRQWASPLAAHLYLSVSRQFEGGLARLGGLSLVAGVAVAEALQALGAVGIGLKWPNDLVVAGSTGLHKLGGILVEGGGQHAGPVRAVIGVGVNVRMPVAVAGEIAQPWVDLAGLLSDLPDRNALAAVLLGSLLPALQQFDSEGLAPFLPRQAALDALAGRPVCIQADEAPPWRGEAAGLAEDGALRVRMETGEVRLVHAGEVSVRAASSRDQASPA